MNAHIARRRLSAQHLTGNAPAPPAFTNPAQAVAWLGAVQAQDYPAGLWGVGLRVPGATEADVESAISGRAIIRTWPMRGTLHFVASADVRWMLKLLTPRVIARSAGRYRQLELDDAVFARCQACIVGALQGGKRLTRPEIYQLLERAGVATTGSRGLHILGHLAQQGLICFGPREGGQPTFALLEEWVPPAGMLKGEEAVAQLARRYFTGHGPATLADFSWWSGLTMTEAKAGLRSVEFHLVGETVDGQTYWFSPDELPAESALPTAHLLPVYDEYTVAYQDRSAVLDPAYTRQAGNGIFSPCILVNGQVIGTWKRTFRKDKVHIQTSLFSPLQSAGQQALSLAVSHYGRFVAKSPAWTPEGASDESHQP
jgi:hypothetical protein